MRWNQNTASHTYIDITELGSNGAKTFCVGFPEDELHNISEPLFIAHAKGKEFEFDFENQDHFGDYETMNLGLKYMC